MVGGNKRPRCVLQSHQQRSWWSEDRIYTQIESKEAKTSFSASVTAKDKQPPSASSKYSVTTHVCSQSDKRGQTAARTMRKWWRLADGGKQGRGGRQTLTQKIIRCLVCFRPAHQHTLNTLLVLLHLSPCSKSPQGHEMHLFCQVITGLLRSWSEHESCFCNKWLYTTF